MSHDEGSNFLDLEPESEWRFELDADESIAVRVQSHDPVYINSEELPTSTWYPLLRNLKSAVYAPSGAQLEVTQLPASQYASSSTTQPALLSLHLALERLRILARRTLSATNGGHEDSYEQIHRGPRVMVLGPPSSGKTSIVKGLVNLATGSGMGWTPAVVGLDPSSPSNLIPGSLSLSLPSNPLSTQHAAHSLGSPPTSVAANTLGADVPTVGWWYGHLEPTNKGADIWKRLVESIGEKLRDKVAKDQTALASGILVDTSSAFTTATLGTRKENPKARYSLLAHAIEALEIDTLVVIGHEKLSIDLTRQFPSVRTIRFPKSGGTVDLDDAYRQVVQAAQVRAYFYGEPSLPKELSNLPGKMVAREGILSPYSFQIGWETLTILRVGEENAAPSTALPLGSSRILSPTRLTKVDPSGPAHITRLLNTVLAVVHLTPGDRIVKDQKVDVKEEKVDVKSEDAVKVEQGEEQEPVAEEDDDDEEVPYREEIGWREIAGFIVITAIDSQKKKYTVLSPSPGFLPSKVAIAGQIEWVDSE